jgi:uncharacterized iron-regulated membrane protein
MTDTTSEFLPLRQARKLSLRKVLGLVHLWIGAIFSIPFAAIGLSGSLWMLAAERPAVIEPAAGPAHTIHDYISAGAALVPAGARPVAFEAPRGGRPAAVRFAENRPRERGGEGQGPRPGSPGFGVRIAVDPATLAPSLSPPGAQGFARVMHDIHGNMMVSGGNGRQFVGWLGVFMTGLGLSGLVMWWPRRGQWKRAFRIKLDGGLLRAVYDLHRFFGFCTLVVFLIVCVSGVYIVFPQAINAMSGAGPAVRDARNQAPMPVSPIENETALDADEVFAIAREAVSDGLLRAVNFPANPRQPYRLTFTHAGDTVAAPQVSVIVDPWAKRVMEIRDPAAYATNDKLLAWQRALHSGRGLGMVWWLLVFVSGLLPPLFAATGVTMWWLRRR